MLREWVRLVREVRPTALVMENVPGLARGHRRQPWGPYEVTWEVLIGGRKLGRATMDFSWGPFGSSWPKAE